VRRWWWLLLLGGVGAWLWQGGGGFFPSARTLTCTLGDSRPLLRAELQLWREEVLLLRATHHLPPGPPTWTQEIHLKPGRHHIQLLTWAEEGQAPQVYRQVLEVGEQKALYLRF